MRITLTSLAGLLPVLLWPAVALAEMPGLLTVELEGLKEATGKVYIAVYDSDDSWLGDETVASREVDIVEARDGDLVRAELQLPQGQYALSVFHDENGNGKLDTNFIGMPREPIALSNNAKAKYGPPKYSDAVFDLRVEPVTQRIRLRPL